MKLAIATVFAAASAEKKVPPRHPLQRLNKLTEFSAELLTNWYSFLPSQQAWINKFANNADRMERNFNRGNQRCGFYDEAQLPHGGPESDRERRAAEEDFRYNREDPAVGTKQICKGFEKWAKRYLSQCSGQKNYNYQVNRMQKWEKKLQAHLANQAEGSGN